CDDFYHANDEGGLAWNDPEIGIDWPIPEGVEPILSERDRKWPGIRDSFRF
ncbi:MAG: dTDP-4-dehydrorhamnose 3,5-epimerase family protein, partial [Faecousia sp.]